MKNWFMLLILLLASASVYAVANPVPQVTPRNITFPESFTGVINASYVCFKDGSCLTTNSSSGSVTVNVSSNVIAKANSTGGLTNSSISDNGINVDTTSQLRIFNNQFLYGNLTSYSAPSANGFVYLGIQTFTLNGSGVKMQITNQNGQTFNFGQYHTANTLSIGNATTTGNIPAFNLLPNGSIGLYTVTPKTQFESNADRNTFRNNVGIGTDVPNSTLEVVGSGPNGTLKVQGTINVTCANAVCQLGDGSTASAIWGTSIGLLSNSGLAAIVSKSQGNGDMSFRTGHTWGSATLGGTERIRINASTGNIGVANSLPNYTLDVSGTGRFATSLIVVDDAVLTVAGLDGSNITSGTINESRLPNSGVGAGTYGNASNVTTFVVDQYGRITSAASQSLLIDVSQIGSGWPGLCSLLGDYQSVGPFRNSSGTYNNCTPSASGIIGVSGITVAYNTNGTVNLTVTASGSGNVTSTNGLSGYIPIFTSASNVDRWVLATSLVNQTYADSTYGNASVNFTCGAGTAVQSGARNKDGLHNTTTCVAVGGSVTVHNITLINSTNGTNSHTITLTYTNGTNLTTTFTDLDTNTNLTAINVGGTSTKTIQINDTSGRILNASFTDIDTNDTTAVGGLYINVTALKANVTNLELQNVTNYNLFLNRTGLPANSTAAGGAYYSSGYVYNGTDIVNYALPLSNAFANMSGINCAANVNGSCNLTVTVTGGSGTPGGSDTYVQYNDGGVFNGDSGFTFNDVTNDVTMLSDLRLTDATGDRGVVFLVSDGAGLVFINSSSRIRLQASGNNLTEVTGKGFYFPGDNPNLDVYDDTNNMTIRVVNSGLGEAYLHVDDKIAVNTTPNNGSTALTVLGTANVTALCIGNDCRTAWPSATGGNTTLEMRDAVNNTGPYNISIPLTNVTGSDTNVCTSTDKVTSVNITNGNLVINCAADAGGSGSPGGADTYIQFNDGGSFGGNINFTYSPSTRDVTLGGGDFFITGPGDRSVIFNASTGAALYYVASSNRLRLDSGGSSSLLEILADGIYFVSGDPELDVYSDSANQTVYIKNGGSQEAWLRVDDKVSIGSAPSTSSDNLVVTGNATVTKNFSTSLLLQNGYASPYAFQSQYYSCQESEFLGSNTGGTAPFTTQTISSGSVAQQLSGSDNHMGLMALRDSTTANGGAFVGLSAGTTGDITPKAGDRLRGIWNVQPAGKIATTTHRTGFFNTVSSSDAVDGCHILWDSAANTATARCRAASATTSNATTYTYTNNTYYGWEVVLYTPTTANFTIWSDSGAVLWDVGLSTGVNTAASNFGIISTQSTTDAAGNLAYVDYMGFCRSYKPQRAWSYGQ